MSRRKSLYGAWFDLAADSLALMQGSAVVITKRSAAMAAAGPNPPPAHQREMRRMVEEKVCASAESWTGMLFAATGAYQSMAMRAMRGGAPTSSAQLQRAAISVIGAAAAPYRSKVRSNVKRLGPK